MTFRYQQRNKAFYWTCFSMFFIGLTIITAGTFLFEDTIMNWKIPTFILLLTGSATAPFTWAGLKKHCDVKNFFLRIFFNVISFGGTLAGLLLILNYYGAGTAETSYKAEIIDVYYTSKNRRGCKIPKVEISIHKTTKLLSFPCGFTMEKSRFVDIKTRPGLLGFDIITDKIPTSQ